jgi:hypothetical protein
MRGADAMQEALFTFGGLDQFVPSDHPLRSVKAIVDDRLRGLNELSNGIYTDTGRASIAPEKLLRSLLLQVFYSVRSERMLMENRSGLVVGAMVTHADGFGERAAALAMLDATPRQPTRALAADKAYDSKDFVATAGASPQGAMQ